MKDTRKTNKSCWNNFHKGMTKDGVKLSFQCNREYFLSKDEYSATKNDNFWALAISIRDRIVERWITTQQGYHKENVKRVYYLSMEFLIGRLLGSFVSNLGLDEGVREGLKELGLDFDELTDEELDAGLGNGGLGRLAACFLDSMATLGVPAHGYGIRFEYGIFNQKIINGYQVELPDEWLRRGSSWEFARPEYSVTVKYYGRTEVHFDKKGNARFEWVDTDDVIAVPYDFPVPGYKNDVVNTLRLWSARSTEAFDFDYFKNGDYEQAVYRKILSENISKVLYPNDSISQGKELRLKQEYFFTAASIKDIIRRFKSENDDIRDLSKKVVIQLNDTHPALAIPELMRVLLDEYNLSWAEAWEVTKNTFAYTNHTLMPEALECWSIDLMENILPRHLQIIYEINAKFLDDVSRQFPGDDGKLQRMSIIQEGYPKKIRMAHLSIIGSYSVNGVSKLHSDLLKNQLFKEFHEFYSSKFNNKTNGITQRLWLLKANPDLSNLISNSIGDRWVTQLDDLSKLLPYKDDKAFCSQWQSIKLNNKSKLAEYIHSNYSISIDPESMFDVQIKRIHEYKRQLLFTFYIIGRYLEIKHNQTKNAVPRTFLIGGKAAPGYFMAKHSIKFINSVAEFINKDKSINDQMKVVFLENYRVSLAEKVFPASNLSEQISTAGTEASGTGNMKFMLNGALTIGTLDGANIEIAQKVGDENIFIFGNKAHEVEEIKNNGYQPMEYINRIPLLKEVMELISHNYFCHYNPGLFDPITESIYNADPFQICADFESYCNAQAKVDELYLDQIQWTKKSIINVAHSGQFSSDRTIKEYSNEIWGIKV